MTALLSDRSTLPASSFRDITRPLAARIASRIACSVEEIAVFPTAACALDALATQVFAGRRVTIAGPAGEPIASRAWAAARSATEVAARPFDGLVAASRDADAVVLTSPAPGTGRATISPRDLLLLRSRAPRPILVLDLLEEECARTPLTQPGLLLPGTMLLRGFGRLWCDAGATRLADIAFIAGPADLVAPLDSLAISGPSVADERSVAEACLELDRPEIERRVQELATIERRASAAGI